MHPTAFAMAEVEVVFMTQAHLVLLPQGAQLQALATELQALTKRTTSYLILTTPQPQQWVLVAAAVLQAIPQALLQAAMAVTAVRVRAVVVVVRAPTGLTQAQVGTAAVGFVL